MGQKVYSKAVNTRAVWVPLPEIIEGAWKKENIERE